MRRFGHHAEAFSRLSISVGASLRPITPWTVRAVSAFSRHALRPKHENSERAAEARTTSSAPLRVSSSRRPTITCGCGSHIRLLQNCSRLALKRRGFSLPDIHCARDASEAAGGVLRAVGNGDITPIEATRVMGLIDSYRRTLELTEIEHRLSALENADAGV